MRPQRALQLAALRLSHDFETRPALLLHTLHRTRAGLEYCSVVPDVMVPRAVARSRYRRRRETNKKTEERLPSQDVALIFMASGLTGLLFLLKERT